MEFLDVERRRALVQTKNRKGQTPLHLAAAFRGGETGEGAGKGVKPIVQVHHIQQSFQPVSNR